MLKVRNLEECTFSCDPQVGTFRDGYFVASPTPADGYVYAEYHGITCAQPIRIVNAEKLLRNDSVVIDKCHDYEIQVLGISGAGSDIVDPSVMNWTSSNTSVASVDEMGVVKALTDGETIISGSGDNFEGTLKVSVQNPKARITTVEQVPIDPTSWAISQSGGKNRVVSILENGMKIEFDGASSRNPYIKLAKKISLWGIPDTLRVRFRPGNLVVNRLSLSTNVVNGAQVITDFLPVENADGEYVCNLPTNAWCDASDLANYPLQLVYIYFSTAATSTGTHYSLEIPGIELVYASQEPSGLNLVPMCTEQLSVEPNPVPAGASISVGGTQSTVQCFNIEGRLLKSVEPVDGKISTAGLTPGVYLLQSEGKSARIIVK